MFSIDLFDESSAFILLIDSTAVPMWSLTEIFGGIRGNVVLFSYLS